MTSGKSLINNIDTEYTGNTNTTNIKIRSKYGF